MKPFDGSNEEQHLDYSVNVTRYTKNKDWMPTTERWESFGYEVDYNSIERRRA